MSAGSAAAESLDHLTPEQVRQVMTLADAYKAHLIRTVGADPDSDRIAQDLQAGGSAEAKAFLAMVEGLSWPERYELIGLMWFGMGEYETFPASRTFAKATADIGIPQYLAKKSMKLSGYLRTALEAIGYRLG